MPENYPLAAALQAGFHQPPVIFSRETRAELVFMIEAKFFAAEDPNLHPGQPVDVALQ